VRYVESLLRTRAGEVPEDARHTLGNQDSDLNRSGNRIEHFAKSRRRGALTCSNSSSLGFASSFLLSLTAVWNLSDVMIARLGWSFDAAVGRV
jgi:hypothetical protein